MAHEELIMKVAKPLKVFDKHVGVRAMGDRCPWKEGPSQVNNFYKGCLKLVEWGELENCKGFFRVNSKSDYKEHSQQLSRGIAEFLRLSNLDVTVHREKTISKIGYRADAIIFLKKQNKGRVFFLEICVKENFKFLNSKVNFLLSWNGATRYLSDLFGVNVPFFDIVTDGLEHPETINLKTFLEDVRDGK